LRIAFADETRHTLQAAGGDDYELCFTAPSELRDEVERATREADEAVTRIGRIVEGTRVQAFASDGREWMPQRPGFEHFV
jgi:thiamine-monophosphate kinase